MKDTAKNIAALGNRILDVLPDMFILYDTDTTILDVLHPLAELMADGPETYIGRRADGACALVGETEHLRAVIETRRPCRFVHRHRRSGDGRVRYFDVCLTCLESGQVLADIRTLHEESVVRMEAEHMRSFFFEALENIAIPISVKSVDTGRYLFWSKKAEIFGPTSAEMIGGTEERFMSPEQARIVQQIDRNLARGEDNRHEGVEKYMTADGREHTFVITRTLFTFGQERLILASALDISELQETQVSLLHTEDELARRNKTLYSVLSLAKVIPWECDLVEQTFFCDYDAYHPDDAAGPDEKGRYIIPMARYFTSIHSDYRQHAVRMIDELARGVREEFHDTYRVHWFNTREWEWVQVQSSVAERDAEGRPVRLVGSAQRITDQKETELALRAAKEDLAVNNAMLSSVLGIAEVLPWRGDLKNGTFSCDYDAYHHESAQGPDAEGRYSITIDEYFSRIHPDYRAAAIGQFMDLVEGRANLFHGIYPIHWFNDREWEWVEALSSIPQYGPDKESLFVIGSARVVTNQKQMEESLRDAKEQAEQSNTLKSAFLANMSHEIRTPLNAIVGFSELLAQTDDPAEKEEYLSIINNSNALLLQLVGDILDLSKIEAGTLEFTFADHDLNALMEELEQTSRMKVDNPEVEVACTGHSPGCVIHTDRGRLMQVLHNFINNAAKFTRRGHIHFGCRRHTDGRWYFYVEDTGCGIPADKVGSVFERFVKLDKHVKGTGLGLAISKSIVERLGGEIGVYSAEGQGATFWFLLPSGSVTPTLKAAPADVKAHPSFCEIDGPMTILVAEDDSANYKLFEAMLRNHYTLLHAWNGREAVELFREHRPGLILMDIKMPEMDGYQATAAIRKLSADVPIIAVTAFAYPEDMRRILASGFNGCLPKPVNADRLKQKISEFCNDTDD